VSKDTYRLIADPTGVPAWDDGGHHSITLPAGWYRVAGVKMDSYVPIECPDGKVRWVMDIRLSRGWFQFLRILLHRAGQP
jgi:hypothetical protein